MKKKDMNQSEADRRTDLDSFSVCVCVCVCFELCRYCYLSPKGNKVQPREPDGDDKKNADLPPDVAKHILRLLGADYPCLFLHQKCFDEDVYVCFPHSLPPPPSLSLIFDE